MKKKQKQKQPIIDPRWRTPLVMDLARQVRGGEEIEEMRDIRGASRLLGDCQTKPDPEVIPILADALQDPPACCDMPEIIEHLKCGAHGPECWVIEALLGDGEAK